MSPEHFDKGGRAEAVVADFQRVADRLIAVASKPGPSLDMPVMPLGECCRRIAVLRQQRQETLEKIGIESHVRRELPEDRPKLGAKPQQAGGEEIGERRLDLAQPQHMGDETRSLDRKDEIVGRFVAPAAEAFGTLQTVEGAVDLDRRKVPGGVGKLLLLRQALRVELAAPGRIGPAGYADAHRSRLFHHRILRFHRRSNPPLDRRKTETDGLRSRQTRIGIST